MFYLQYINGLWWCLQMLNLFKIQTNYKLTKPSHNRPWQPFFCIQFCPWSLETQNSSVAIYIIHLSTSSQTFNPSRPISILRTSKLRRLYDPNYVWLSTVPTSNWLYYVWPVTWEVSLHVFASYSIY